MSKYLDMQGLTYFYNQLKSKFAFKSDIGAPSKAATASSMTDTNKIYIYTGSETGYTEGHWYYYDNGSWHDGGAYNSIAVVTDKTLSAPDQPADAKVTGDQIAILKSAVTMNDIETSLDMAWEVGSIRDSSDANAGANQTSSKRIRSGSNLYFSFDEINRINVGSGYKLIVCVYSSSSYSSFEGMYNGHTTVSDITWLSEDIYISKTLSGKYFRLVLGKTDDSTAAISDGQHVTFWEYQNEEIKGSLRSRFNGKKISIIGDSIETFDKTGYKIDGYRMYYPALDVTSVDQTWWKQVIDNSGAQLEVNASWSGSRVTNTHENASYPDFYSRIALVGSPDIIFVALGTNDSTNNVALGEYDFTTTYTNLSESQFRPAYIKGIKALKNTYSSAQIICVLKQMGASYKESIKRIAKELSVEVIDASDYIGASGVHPGEVGMRQIASHILFPTDGDLWQAGYPADAKYTGDAITDTKSAIPSQTENPCFFKARVQTDGSITLSDERYLLSIPFYDPKKYFKASCASGYTYEILAYTKNNDTYTYAGVYDPSISGKINTEAACWVEGEQHVTLPSGYYYRVMGKLVSENSITEDDSANFFIYSNTGSFIADDNIPDYPLGSTSVFDMLSYLFEPITYSLIPFTDDNSLINTYNNVSRGVGTDSSYHGITPYLKMNFEFTVNLPSGYKFKWYEYSEAAYTTYTKRFASYWLDSGTTVKCNPCYYKIAVCKANGAVVDFTEIKNEVSIITYNYKYSFDTTLWNYGAWTHGSINTSDGASNGTAEKYQNRCRTPLLAVRDMDMFSFDTTIVVTAYYYSSDSTSSYLGSVKHERINNPFSIATDLVQYPTATHIRFCVYYQDNRNIANVEECIRSIKINIDPRYAVSHDTPDSQGAENMVNRAYDLTNIRYTVTNNLPAQETSSFPSNYVPTGTLCIGVKYSSTRNEQLYVPQAVSLKSYASAILNPNSYIYTRISEVSPGVSPNSLTYYGAVCSTFVAYAYGIDSVIPTTLSFSSYPGFHRLPDHMQNPNSLKIGYMLNHRGSHISLVTDIIRDSSGKVLYIQLSEAWHPYMEKNYRTPEWVKTERFEAGFEAYWYDYIDAVPAADNSTWMNMDSSLYTSGALNSNLAPRRGEDANWRLGETVEIDVIDQGSYTSYVLVNRSTNSVISTASLSGSLISLSGLNAGEYKLYLSTGSTNSAAVNFNVIGTTETYSVSGNNVTVTYQSTTGTPSAILFSNNCTSPVSDYKAVRAFHVLTESEISAGTCTISKPDDSELEYAPEREYPNGVWKMRVMYKTDFGLYSSDFADVQF